jgi:hypothetical protein
MALGPVLGANPVHSKQSIRVYEHRLLRLFRGGGGTKRVRCGGE